ncbi:MAG: hypothetical protein RLZZ417_242 [Bacteroidota bacterium]|jgi:uncharacterized protein (DUF2141 family)
MLYILFYSLYTLINTPITLEIKVEGLIPEKGTIRIGLYNSAAAFQDEANPNHAKVVTVGKNASQIIKFEGLPEGKYLVAAYQDVNGNQKIDKNFIGIPTEAYAFSNDVFPKWKSPSFNDAAIKLEKPFESIKLKFRTWIN